jgi:Asp-tRNA(Asn)/Glu-tRNA(Gln) amidotransferase A subunit family amidase
VLPRAVLAEIDRGVAAHYGRCCDILRSSALVRVSESQPFDFLALARAALWEVSSQFAARVGFQTAAFARSRAVLGAELGTLLERASTLPSSALEGGRALLEDGRRRFAAHLADVDALLTPTCPTRAIGASAAVPKNLSAFLVPANVAGLPAICWPQTLAPSGSAKHPARGEVGSLQLIGKAGRDRPLLDLAAMTQSLLAGATAMSDTDHVGATESPH